MEEAKKWWDGITFEEKFTYMIKYLGVHDQPGLLTQAQILEIYTKHKS